MKVAPKDANDYARFVLSKDTAPEASRKGISKQIGSFCNQSYEPFLNLDGNFYFDNALADCRRTPLKGTPLGKRDKEPEEVSKKREKLRSLLKGLVDNGPRPFYAILLMDGDNMGKMIVEMGGKPISKALSIFTEDVRPIVKKHNGVTIYAGGDDVLAMLPLPNALDCAQSLSQKYQQSFLEVIPEAEATISAGVVFSHYHIPLRSVMEEAHTILDDVAKDQNGRDSIAVSVLKSSGKYCQWTVTWNRLSDDNGKNRIDDLVFRVQEGPYKQFSKSFFYNMRDDLSILSGDQLSKPGSYAKLAPDLDPCRLLTAEYMKSREREVTKEEAEERIKALLELSYRSRKAKETERMFLSPDAAMLIKFLSQASDGGSK